MQLQHSRENISDIRMAWIKGNENKNMRREVKIQVIFMSTFTIKGKNSDAKICKDNVDIPGFCIAR